MNAGKMRHRISFEREETVVTENNFREQKYLPYKTVYASVNNLFGREFWAAQANQLENTVIFSIRYNKDIENLDIKKARINFKGRYFSIIHVDNVRYENRELKVKAIELAE